MKDYDQLRALYEQGKLSDFVQDGGRLIEQKEESRLLLLNRPVRKLSERYGLIHVKPDEHFCKSCGLSFVKDDAMQCPRCGSPGIHPKQWIHLNGCLVYFKTKLVPPALKEYIPGCEEMLKATFSNMQLTNELREALINATWTFFVRRAAENNIAPEKWFI